MRGALGEKCLRGGLDGRGVSFGGVGDEGRREGAVRMGGRLAGACGVQPAGVGVRMSGRLAGAGWATGRYVFC